MSIPQNLCFSAQCGRPEAGLLASAIGPIPASSEMFDFDAPDLKADRPESTLCDLCAAGGQ